MKNFFKNAGAFFAFAVIALTASFSAKADDCSQSVDKICTAYEAVADKLNATTDLQQLMGINFIADVMAANDSADKDCYSYELTGDDKAKLVKGFDHVMETLVKKADEFTDGAAGGMLKGQLQPMLDEFHAQVEETRTLGDYVNGMNEQ